MNKELLALLSQFHPFIFFLEVVLNFATIDNVMMKKTTMKTTRGEIESPGTAVQQPVKAGKDLKSHACARG